MGEGINFELGEEPVISAEELQEWYDRSDGPPDVDPDDDDPDKRPPDPSGPETGGGGHELEQPAYLGHVTLIGV